MNTKYQYLALAAVALGLAACGGKSEKRAKKGEQPQAAAAEAGAQSCHAATDADIAALFDRWNGALKTGVPENVVANYAPDSVLLPTLSDKVRYSKAEKLDYFKHFLEKKPAGEIVERSIQIGCNNALDAGVYTFSFADGSKATGRYSYTYAWDGKNWLITSHHSSLMPEQQAVQAAHNAPAH